MPENIQILYLIFMYSDHHEWKGMVLSEGVNGLVCFLEYFNFLFFF